MTAVVVDDEPLARLWLRQSLAQQGVEVLGEAETGIEAIRRSAELRPDVVFLDIRMPDLSGLEATAALGQLAKPPRLVFVTGHAEHAVEAFARVAFDYLLKPVSAERLASTVARLRNAAAKDALGRDATESQGPFRTHPGPLARLPVRTDYAIRLLRIEDIECAVARQKRVYVRTGTEELKTAYTLTQLETLLPSGTFMRIHASVIAQVDRIETINFLGNHTYNARLASGTIVPVGRNQYPELQRRLGVG